MIALTVCVFVMIFMLDRLRLESHAIDLMESRFELFRVRDLLRTHARYGEIPYDEWFAYVDTTVSRTIEEIDQITIWHGLGYVLMYGNDERINRAIGRLKQHLDGAPSLKQVDAEYLQCIRRLLRKRHGFLWFCLNRSLKAAGFAADIKKRVVFSFTSAPETSTLLQYAALTHPSVGT